MNDNDGGEHGWLVGEFHVIRELVGLCSGEKVGILGAGWETPWVLVMKEEGY
jgi:hypothetical protein